MLGSTFYHETMRKCVVGFGTLFNDIHITRKDSSGNIIQSMKVPLAYGAKQKFLVRLTEDPSLTKTVAITLPRIGFEIGQIAYDSSRKLNKIQKVKKESKIVMLTGYGNIPTAVAAVKAGAIDYIPKPADAADVENALLALPESKAIPPENPMSADRVKWEHIHRVFELCNRNVSETERRLKMHRRTLQRILSKRSPR